MELNTKILVWLVYASHFLLHWYENKTIVMTFLEKPNFLRDPFFMVLLWITRLALHYGSLIAIWYLYGLGTAVGAYGVGYLFGSKTFNFYFDKAVHNMLPFAKKQIQEEVKVKNIHISEAQISIEAYKRAEDLIIHVMKH